MDQSSDSSSTALGWPRGTGGVPSFARTLRTCDRGRNRQCSSIQFPVRCERHLIELVEGGRHHVGGQSIVGPGAELISGDPPPGDDGVPGLEPYVVDAPLHGDHGTFVDRWMFDEHRLDLSEFDAIATYLHLVVDSLQVLDAAVGEVLARDRRFGTSAATRRSR